LAGWKAIEIIGRRTTQRAGSKSTRSAARRQAARKPSPRAGSVLAVEAYILNVCAEELRQFAPHPRVPAASLRAEGRRRHGRFSRHTTHQRTGEPGRQGTALQGGGDVAKRRHLGPRRGDEQHHKRRDDLGEQDAGSQQQHDLDREGRPEPLDLEACVHRDAGCGHAATTAASNI
jgi:hypothetical protein